MNCQIRKQPSDMAPDAKRLVFTWLWFHAIAKDRMTGTMGNFTDVALSLYCTTVAEMTRPASLIVATRKVDHFWR